MQIALIFFYSIFQKMEEIFKISTNEGCASDSWRALLFSPTRDGVDLLLHHLPFKTVNTH